MDGRVLVDVLSAFASIRDPDALPVVLSFVNSVNSQVRAASREAVRAYGHEALGRIRSTYAALAGKHLPDGTDAPTAARALFEAYDQLRLADVYARFNSGLAKERSGNHDDAIADFLYAIALQPDLDRAAEAAPVFEAYAKRMEGSDPKRAADLLNIALRLLGSAPRADSVRSELRRLDGDELLAAGIVDTAPFEQAVALDPGNERAREQLGRLRTQAASKRKDEGYVAAGVGGAGLWILAVGIIGLRRSRRRAHA